MPWKECHVMDERLRFVARLARGRKDDAVVQRIGISRKTGYKIFERYKDHGQRRSPIAAAVRIGKPMGGRHSWKRRLCG